MKRTLSGMLCALVLGGAVFSGVVISKPAEAAPRHSYRNYRNWGPSSRYRTSRYRYYRSGRWYSTPLRGKNGDLDRDGIRNKNDRDRDGDGRRNKRDDHPSNPRRR